MVDQTANDGDEVEVEAIPKKKGLSGKKLVLFIVLPLLLIGGGGAGAYFTGMLDSVLGVEKAEGDGEHGEDAAEGAHEDDAAAAAMAPSVFHELPTMLVNLNEAGKRASYLKISIKLELTNEQDVAAVTTIQPRIIDRFQVYLRELRVEDLEGSAGMQRLREELLNRVNKVAHPVKVRDVLFAELLVQ